MREVIRNPTHPYTQGLLRALPKLDDLDAPLTPVPGDIPSPLERPPGCVFHTRCPGDRRASATRLARVPTRRSKMTRHTARCFAATIGPGGAGMNDMPASDLADSLSVHFPSARGCWQQVQC